jgi:hypothetical protein
MVLSDSEAVLALSSQGQRFPLSSLPEGLLWGSLRLRAKKNPALAGLLWEYRYRDSNPGFRRERAAS